MQVFKRKYCIKFRAGLMTGSITKLPHGIVVVSFQHFVNLGLGIKKNFPKRCIRNQSFIPICL